MKILKFFFLLTFTLIFGLNLTYGEGDPSKPKPYTTSEKERLTERYYENVKKAEKEFAYRTGKPIDFYIDFQLGVGATSPNIKETQGTSVYQSSSKLGYTVGGIVYLSLFDMISFSTGLTFDGKSFSVTTPSILPPGVDTSTVKPNTTSYIPGNYINIPLNLNFGGMVTKDVGLWFNGGPYLAFLMSSPDNNSTALGYKNFDLGVNATLTANYVFFYPFSLILGTNFKYGGLNNLGSTNLVESIKTSNFTFFSGVRFGF